MKLTVRRYQEPLVLELKLGKFHHTQPFIASVRPEPVFGLKVDYLNFQLPQHQVRPEGVDGKGGVGVREIVADSAAARKFKTLGDNPSRWIITRVNGTLINTPAEFYKAAKGQQTVKLTLRDWSETGHRELTIP